MAVVVSLRINHSLHSGSSKLLRGAPHSQFLGTTKSSLPLYRPPIVVLGINTGIKGWISVPPRLSGGYQPRSSLPRSKGIEREKQEKASSVRSLERTMEALHCSSLPPRLAIVAHPSSHGRCRQPKLMRKKPAWKRCLHVSREGVRGSIRFTAYEGRTQGLKCEASNNRDGECSEGLGNGQAEDDPKTRLSEQTPDSGNGTKGEQEGLLEADGPSIGEGRLGRRPFAVLLPLLAAVSATSKAAAQVAAPPELESPPPPSADVEPDLPKATTPKVSKVSLKILEGCTLGVSFYPDFGYNPGNGGGSGTAVDLGDGRMEVTFDPSTLNIPPLSFDSTTFVGLPLPPPLKITIVPTLLSGIINRTTGEVDLAFKSKFYFTAGPIYSAPALKVETRLTTESSIGSIREGYGTRLNSQGQGTLAAVAVVPPVEDPFFDRFLSLPTEVLAVLPAQFIFEE